MFGRPIATTAYKTPYQNHYENEIISTRSSIKEQEWSRRFVLPANKNFFPQTAAYSSAVTGRKPNLDFSLISMGNVTRGGCFRGKRKRTRKSLKGRALQLSSAMAALSLRKTPILLGLARSSGQDRQRMLFEACRNGDIEQVKALMTAQNVNSRDLSGRKSTPLHFAAGKQAQLALSGIVHMTV